MDIITLIQALVSGLINAQEESKNEILNSASPRSSSVYFDSCGHIDPRKRET